MARRLGRARWFPAIRRAHDASAPKFTPIGLMDETRQIRKVKSERRRRDRGCTKARVAAGFSRNRGGEMACGELAHFVRSVRTRDLLNPIQPAQHPYTSIHFSTHRFRRFDFRTLPYTPAHFVTAGVTVRAPTLQAAPRSPDFRILSVVERDFTDQFRSLTAVSGVSPYLNSPSNSPSARYDRLAVPVDLNELS